MSLGYSGNVGVRAFIPVQVAFNINHVADLQAFNSLVYIAVFVGQIVFNAEVEHLTVSSGETDIQVVRVGGVLAAEGCAVILRGNGQSLEQNLFILMVNQIICTQRGGNVFRFRDEGISFKQFEGGIGDFHFTGPFALEAPSLLWA